MNTAGAHHDQILKKKGFRAALPLQGYIVMSPGLDVEEK